jgi:TolA-binding protein
MVQPTNLVAVAQLVQQLRVAEAEIDELKQSLRYVEIQLAKNQEEKEVLEKRVKSVNAEQDRGSEQLGQQM